MGSAQALLQHSPMVAHMSIDPWEHACAGAFSWKSPGLAQRDAWQMPRCMPGSGGSERELWALAGVGFDPSAQQSSSSPKEAQGQRGPHLEMVPLLFPGIGAHQLCCECGQHRVILKDTSGCFKRASRGVCQRKRWRELKADQAAASHSCLHLGIEKKVLAY